MIFLTKTKLQLIWFEIVFNRNLVMSENIVLIPPVFRLFGLENETSMLNLIFDKVSIGDSEVVFVTGYTGSGKSSMVSRFIESVGQRGCVVASGRYSMASRAIPYSSFFEALRSLISNLLVSDEETQRRVGEGLGIHAAILSDVIPELEKLVGRQPSPARLKAVESKNRFYLAMKRFLSLIGSAASPLVLFLDDVHSADVDSLKLIESLAFDRDLRHLMLICAYRENGVGCDEPLLKMVRRMRRSEWCTFMEIKPLDLINTNRYVSTLLQSDPCSTRSLSEIVQQKTHGNPLFIRQFLKKLIDKAFIMRDAKGKGFTWKRNEMEAIDLSEETFGMMVWRIQKLPAELLFVLKIGACFGPGFNAAFISEVGDLPVYRVVAALQEAVTLNLIVPQSETVIMSHHEIERMFEGEKERTYRISEHLWEKLRAVPEISLEDRFSFSITGMESAVEALMDKEELEYINLRVARSISKDMPLDEESLFKVVAHYNRSDKLVTLEDERMLVAELNLLAAKKARNKAAFESAFTYLTKAMALVSPNPFSRNYRLSLDIYSEAAEAAFMTGRFDVMEDLSDVVEKEARSLMDRLRIDCIRIDAEISRNRIREAIEMGLSLLNAHGLSCSYEPKTLRIFFY